MKIQIFSRCQIEELLREGFPEKTAVISFYDPETSRFLAEDYRPVDYKEKTDRLFQVSLHDIDLSVLPEYGLTYETYFPEADALAEFIYSAKADGYDIICQCEYGESRSSGCAAAILEHFYKNGISVFADYRYYPNQVVYHKVLEALEKFYETSKRSFFGSLSAVVYMNPNIGEDYIKDIMEIYRLSEYPSIKYDYSKHYKCYLDVGWKAEGRR